METKMLCVGKLENKNVIDILNNIECKRTDYLHACLGRCSNPINRRIENVSNILFNNIVVCDNCVSILTIQEDDTKVLINELLYVTCDECNVPILPRNMNGKLMCLCDDISIISEDYHQSSICRDYIYDPFSYNIPSFSNICSYSYWCRDDNCLQHFPHPIETRIKDTTCYFRCGGSRIKTIKCLCGNFIRKCNKCPDILGKKCVCNIEPIHIILNNKKCSCSNGYRIFVNNDIIKCSSCSSAYCYVCDKCFNFDAVGIIYENKICGCYHHSHCYDNDIKCEHGSYFNFPIFIGELLCKDTLKENCRCNKCYTKCMSCDRSQLKSSMISSIMVTKCYCGYVCLNCSKNTYLANYKKCLSCNKKTLDGNFISSCLICASNKIAVNYAKNKYDCSCKYLICDLCVDKCPKCSICKSLSLKECWEEYKNEKVNKTRCCVGRISIGYDEGDYYCNNITCYCRTLIEEKKQDSQNIVNDEEEQINLDDDIPIGISHSLFIAFSRTLSERNSVAEINVGEFMLFDE